ncbi:MAG: hypothetical protein ACE5H1_11690 [Thermodesulfobacteriota bacterium]
MAEKKEPKRVKDFTDPVKDLSGLVKENYLNGFDFTVSLWEENVKAINSQVDYLLNAEKEYAKTVKQVYSKLPTELSPVGNGNSKLVEEGFDRLISLQKEYVDTVKNISDKLTKETKSLTHKNVEKAFSLFDDYIEAFTI